MTNPTEADRKPKLCYVVSSPMTAIAFLNGHIDHLATDFDITVVCNFDGSESQISWNAKTKNIKIARSISPFADALAIWKLYRFLRRVGFDIVHSVSPKAGLVTAVSGWFARTPIRIHWFTGQVWVLKGGIQRQILKLIDQMVATLNTYVLVDSPSQRGYLIQLKVVKAEKSGVLGPGSIAGVDTKRFRPDPEMRARIRFELEITDPDALIILFTGRLNRDKGINTLLEVFRNTELPRNCYLVLVGSDEGNYLSRIPSILGDKFDRFRHIHQTPNPENYMAACDILCLPSLREGFGLVLIEAAAVGVPVLASRIYGITDAVTEGETGLLFAPGDAEDLCLKLETLILSDKLRNDLGCKALRDASLIWEHTKLQMELKEFYRRQRSIAAREFGKL